jgi:hypothetical protein
MSNLHMSELSSRKKKRERKVKSSLDIGGPLPFFPSVHDPDDGLLFLKRPPLHPPRHISLHRLPVQNGRGKQTRLTKVCVQPSSSSLGFRIVGRAPVLHPLTPISSSTASFTLLRYRRTPRAVCLIGSKPFLLSSLGPDPVRLSSHHHFRLSDLHIFPCSTFFQPWGPLPSIVQRRKRPPPPSPPLFERTFSLSSSSSPSRSISSPPISGARSTSAGANDGPRSSSGHSSSRRSGGSPAGAKPPCHRPEVARRLPARSRPRPAAALARMPSRRAFRISRRKPLLSRRESLVRRMRLRRARAL